MANYNITRKGQHYYIFDKHGMEVLHAYMGQVRDLAQDNICMGNITKALAKRLQQPVRKA